MNGDHIERAAAEIMRLTTVDRATATICAAVTLMTIKPPGSSPQEMMEAMMANPRKVITRDEVRPQSSLYHFWRQQAGHTRDTLALAQDRVRLLEQHLVGPIYWSEEERKRVGDAAWSKGPAVAADTVVTILRERNGL